jgi:hypothetical protein
MANIIISDLHLNQLECELVNLSDEQQNTVLGGGQDDIIITYQGVEAIRIEAPGPDITITFEFLAKLFGIKGF